MSKDIKNIKIDTPSLIIFHEKFLNNILKLKIFFLNSNVIIRPHAKTHKMSRNSEDTDKKWSQKESVCKKYLKLKYLQIMHQ